MGFNLTKTGVGAGLKLSGGVGRVLAERYWTPELLGSSLALWLDAADASTITLNGSNVSQWNDKSGNNNHASQAAAVSQPEYAAVGFNNKPSIRFNQDFLQNNVATFSLINRSVFLVVDETTNANNAGILAVGLTPGQTDWRGLDRFVIETSAITNEIFSVANIGDYSLPIVGQSAQGIYGEIKSAGIGSLYKNGELRITDAAFTEFNTTSSAGYLLGARWLSGIVNSTTNGFIGDISEIIYTSSTLSTEDRQRVEGYLAWKWSGLL
jgi:hypothetical protein